MATMRMQAGERRSSIIEAAVPLFARRGFGGATTKEIAGAAGVSEALLFKHFPSKADLYREIVLTGCRGDPELERLTSLKPSTQTLVGLLYGMARHFLADEVEAEERETRLRLILQSYLADGEYARSLFDWVMEAIFPTFEAGLKAAARSGDVRLAPIHPDNAFWFAQHVSASMAFSLLPKAACIPHRGGREALIEQTTRFVLRGLGMRDETITAAVAAEKRELAPPPRRGAKQC